MKYYTDCISVTLAEKLKEKGMPVEENNRRVIGWIIPTYAEVFDWLMERGIRVSILHRETSVGLGWYPMVNGKCPYAIDGKEWYHSAIIAIEYALTLI